jgi:hypothetical protein
MRVPVTETEWLECTDPEALLWEAGGTTSGRRLRLFAVACCRRIWHLLPDDACRQAVVVAERHADGRASTEELRAASSTLVEPAGLGAACAAVLRAVRNAAWVGADVAYPPRQAVYGALDAASAAAYLVAPAGTRAHARVAAAERVVQCRLLRDILGNPYRPLAPRSFPAPVLGLAESVYEGDHALYPVLADALADLGEERAAAHCREPLHVKGCHIVDWVRGRR